MTPRPAAEIDDGWIYVPHPAAAPGWYQIATVQHTPGWSEFRCGRGIPYTIASHVELHWRPTQPDGNRQPTRSSTSDTLNVEAHHG